PATGRSTCGHLELLRARRPRAGQRDHRQLRRPLPEGRPGPGRGREADRTAPEGNRGPAGEGGAEPRPWAGGSWRPPLRGLAARTQPVRMGGKLRTGGEGKESNLPSPTRRDKPVLKTGGATGPLPSPLRRPDAQRSGSCDACKVRQRRRWTARALRRYGGAWTRSSTSGAAP